MSLPKFLGEFLKSFETTIRVFLVVALNLIWLMYAAPVIKSFKKLKMNFLTYRQSDTEKRTKFLGVSPKKTTVS